MHDQVITPLAHLEVFARPTKQCQNRQATLYLLEVLFRNLRNNFHVKNEDINYELEFLEKLALGNYNENPPIIFKEILNKKCTL